MTPLIDVVFLLLTFFVFSLVLMVRAETLDVELPTLRGGTAAESRESVTVAVDERGVASVDGEQAELVDLPVLVSELLERRPSARLLIAVDELAPAGAVLGVVDALAGAGITDFALLGRPAAEPGAATGDAASQEPTEPSSAQENAPAG